MEADATRTSKSVKKMNILDAFFGPRPLNEGLVREALKGATDVIIHPCGRVMVLKRGQRADMPVSPVVAAEVLRALDEGKLLGLLPRAGKSSANLRIRR
jgi:hypothetical protein